MAPLKLRARYPFGVAARARWTVGKRPNADVAGDSRPWVFIGSSTESLPVAKALASLLEQRARIIRWDIDIFKPGEVGFDSLIDAAARSDFAVLVFGHDDIVTSRDSTQLAPRDNVIFEAGLFIGALGHTHTFIVHDDAKRPRIPTDLAGLTTLTYRDEGFPALAPSLENVVARIRQRMDELGPPPRRGSRPPTVYWCGPHGNPHNIQAAAVLERYGIAVNMPSQLARIDPSMSVRERSVMLRGICCRAIRESDLVVVDLDSYGLDSAWEMGFAEASGVRILGVSSNAEAVDEERLVNKRPYHENPMHGWDQSFVSRDLDQIAQRCEDKIVYLCCPLRTTDVIETVRESAIGRSARRLIVSMDFLTFGQEPRDYAWRSRTATLRHIQESDVLLTILPRYGMDTAWLLGYAKACGKETVGWVGPVSESATSRAQFLDHWTHGWKQKTWVTDLRDLAALIKGLAASGP
jgi:predicted nucleotide-binding protein/nucleoside 2-deoxyribosyltransferase